MSIKFPRYNKHANGQAYVKCAKLGPKIIYLGKYGSSESKSRYQRLISKIALGDLASGPAGQLVSKAIRSMTIIELIELYDSFVEKRYTSAEYKEIASTLDIVDRLFGDYEVNDFGPAELTSLQEHMVALDISRGVINQRIGRIKRFFRWASQRGHCRADLYYGLSCVNGLKLGELGARETEEIQPVPIENVIATLPFLTPIVAAIVKIQLWCGMRPGEACAMRPCDIDQSGDIWLYKPKKHKNLWRGHLRVIAIPKSAQLVIQPLLNRGNEEFLFVPAESEAWRKKHRNPSAKDIRKTKIYPCEIKQREARKKARAKEGNVRNKSPHYTTDTYRNAVCYGIKMAVKSGVEMPHWHPNQLRHTMATDISSNISEQAAQRWLGHARLDTTAIYAKKQLSELLSIAEMVDERWGLVLESELPQHSAPACH